MYLISHRAVNASAMAETIKVSRQDIHDLSNDRSGENSVYGEGAPSPGGVDVQCNHHDVVVVKVDAPEDG